MTTSNVNLDRIRALLGLGSRRRLLGFSFVLAVSIIWVVASFAVQGIEETGVHPIVLTFIANSMFACYLPIYAINLKRRENRRAHPSHTDPSDSQALFPAPLPRSTSPTSPRHRGSASTTSTPALADLHRTALRAAAIVAPLWFLAQLTFNASLSLTSVTSNTILSSTSALFTFLFAVALLSEQFTLIKLCCIAALTAGTTMVTLADASSADSPGSIAASRSTLGDVLCLLSAVVYGGYTVAIRKTLGDDEGSPTTLFFGIMGGLIFVGIGSLLGTASLMGARLGSLTWRSFGLVVAKGLLDNVLSDYLWARAILLVGPTVATSGLSMQVPIAVLLDALLRSPAWLRSVKGAVMTLLGAVVVLIGFFGLNAGGGTDGEQDGEGALARRRWEQQAEALQAELNDLETETVTLSGNGSAMRAAAGPLKR